MKPNRQIRLWVWIFLVLLVAGFFVFDLSAYLDFQRLQAKRAALVAYRLANPGQAAAGFFLLYVAVTGLSLPGATVLGLAAGAVFGFVQGTLLVSFASTIGATLAFLVARYLARDAVQRRFGQRLAGVDQGIEKEGPFYLFALRLVPVFPFFVINLLMGLTAMRTWTYLWVSQVGMLAGTMAYVNAGTRLANLATPADVVSPGLLGAFAALGLLPLIAKRLLGVWRGRRALKGWTRPRRFDRNLVVIGAGAAGLVSAYVAAAARAKVTLVEKDRMGGDCLNTGCVPSKALIRAARFAADARRAADFGIRLAAPQVDFAAVMARVQAAVRRVEPHDSVARYTRLGVECLHGEAQIRSPWEVAVGDRVLRTRSIVIATGAGPVVPPIAGLDRLDYLTSDNLWSLRELPARLLVFGGGPVGCELAQSFARLGARVSLVEMAPMLLPREDAEVSELIGQSLAADGVDLELGQRAEQFETDANGHRVLLQSAAGEQTLRFDRVLVALGRRAHTDGLGLERLGLETNANGTLKVDEYLRTSLPNVYACGDVAGPYQFTHAAAHQAWHGSVNALFGRFKRFRVDYSALPFAIYTDPEVARVGLNETEAKARGLDYETVRYDLAELDRAIVDGEERGFVKVLTAPGRDRILGATLVGAHAGELVGQFTAAMKNGDGLGKLLGTIQPYPSFAEASKYLAGQWRRAHAPERILRLAAWWHRRRLG